MEGWKIIDPGLEDGLGVLVIGGVWLGVELVGESGVWTCSLDEENPSFDEVAVES